MMSRGGEGLADGLAAEQPNHKCKSCRHFKLAMKYGYSILYQSKI